MRGNNSLKSNSVCIVSCSVKLPQQGCNNQLLVHLHHHSFIVSYSVVNHGQNWGLDGCDNASGVTKCFFTNLKMPIYLRTKTRPHAFTDVSTFVKTAGSTPLSSSQLALLDNHWWFIANLVSMYTYLLVAICYSSPHTHTNWNFTVHHCESQSHCESL